MCNRHCFLAVGLYFIGNYIAKMWALLLIAIVTVVSVNARKVPYSEYSYSKSDSQAPRSRLRPSPAPGVGSPVPGLSEILSASIDERRKQLTSLLITHIGRLEATTRCFQMLVVYISRPLRDNLLHYTVGIDSVPIIRLFLTFPLFFSRLASFRKFRYKARFLARVQRNSAIVMLLLALTVFPDASLLISQASQRTKGFDIMKLISTLFIAGIYAFFELSDLSACTLGSSHLQSEYIFVSHGLSPLLAGAFMYCVTNRFVAKDAGSALARSMEWSARGMALLSVLQLLLSHLQGSLLPPLPDEPEMAPSTLGIVPIENPETAPEEMIELVPLPVPEPDEPVQEPLPVEPPIEEPPVVETLITEPPTKAKPYKPPPRLPPDVVPASLGVETTNGEVTKVILRRASIPVTKSLLFATARNHQKTATIKVYEGDDEFTHQNILLGKFELKGLRAKPQERAKIVIVFDINRKGILSVTAQEYLPNPYSSHKLASQSLVVKKVSVMSRKRLEKLLAEPQTPRPSLLEWIRSQLQRLKQPQITPQKLSPVEAVKQELQRQAAYSKVSPKAAFPVSKSSKSAGVPRQPKPAFVPKRPAPPPAPTILTITTRALLRRISSVFASIDGMIGSALHTIQHLGELQRLVFPLAVLTLVSIYLLDLLWRVTALKVFPVQMDGLQFGVRLNILMGAVSCLALALRRRNVIQPLTAVFSFEARTVAVCCIPFLYTLHASITTTVDLYEYRLLALYTGLVFNYVVPALFSTIYASTRQELFRQMDISDSYLFNDLGGGNAFMLVALLVSSVIQLGVSVFTKGLLQGSLPVMGIFGVCIVSTLFLSSKLQLWERSRRQHQQPQNNRLFQ